MKSPRLDALWEVSYRSGTSGRPGERVLLGPGSAPVPCKLACMWLSSYTVLRPGIQSGGLEHIPQAFLNLSPCF